MSNLLSDAKNIFIGDENKIAKPIAKFSPLGFTTPGANVTTGPGGFTVGRSPQVGNSLAQINNQAINETNAFRNLKSQVAPGFGRMTTEGVKAIEDKRRATVSNLRDNLGRRRVLGSSFADDAVSRTNAEFAKQEAQFRAETTLQEIQATEKLITKQYEASIKGSLAFIEQSNFETEIGAELSRQYTAVMGELAKYEAQLLRDEADGQAALLSALLSGGLGGAFGGIGGAVGDLLGDVVDGVGSAVGGAVGGAIGAGKDAIGGLLGGAAGAAAGGAIATAQPGFAPHIPMTPLPPEATGSAASLATPFGAYYGSPAGSSAGLGIGSATTSGSLGTLSTAPLSESVIGSTGQGAMFGGAESGAALFGPSEGLSGAFSETAGATPGHIGISGTGGTDVFTTGAEAIGAPGATPPGAVTATPGAGTAPGTAAAKAAPPKGSLLTGASGAAIAGGTIAATMALLNGEGLGQAASQGAGAAGGAALGFQVGMAAGGPIGATIGGMLGGIGGSLIGGSLGKALGLSASGGGDDKPDYSLGSGDNLTGKALTSTGVWGTVGFGHFKHLTDGGRYQAALEAVTETDRIISTGLSPEENEKVKAAFKHNFIGKNSNEGGFNPGRLMSQVFNNRSATLKKVLGPRRFNELKLGEIYTALSSGDADKINAAFGVA